jgi:hypothetical protein
VPTSGIATGGKTVVDSYIGADTLSIGESADGLVFYNAGSTANTVSYVANDVVGIAFDAGAGLLWWNNWTGSSGWIGTIAGDPVAGTNGFAINATITSHPMAFAFGVANATTNTASFTIRTTAGSFTGTQPTGYQAAGLMGALSGSCGKLALLGVGCSISFAGLRLPMLIGGAACHIGKHIRRNATISRRQFLGGHNGRMY